MSTFAEDYRRVTADNYNKQLHKVVMALRELAERVQRAGFVADTATRLTPANRPAHTDAVQDVLNEIQNGLVMLETAQLVRTAVDADAAWVELEAEQAARIPEESSRNELQHS